MHTPNFFSREATTPHRKPDAFVGIAVVLALLAPIGLVHAQSSMGAPQKSGLPDPVQVTLERKKVSLADGKEVLVFAASAKPGEVIEETATYSNRSKRTFRVDATLPVPA